MNIPSKSVTVRIGTELHTLFMPADPEGAMQKSWDLHGEDESFFPFWLEAWPSSFGLYDFLLREQIPLDGAWELGCGCGVLAQLLQTQSGSIYHTDIVPGACSFARRHVESPQARYFLAMDMTRPCIAQKPSLVFGADLFYEYRLVEYACEFVRKHLEAGGQAYFADPERPSRPEVPQWIQRSGVRFKRIPWEYSLNGHKQQLAIWQMSP